MKVQYCHLLDKKYIETEIYYVAYLNWSLLEEMETKLALYKSDTQRHKIEKETGEGMKIATPYAASSHGVNIAQYKFMKWLYEYMIAESGETYIVSSSIDSLINILEKAILFEGKSYKIPLKTIRIFSSETRHPIGEFTYKVYN